MKTTFDIGAPFETLTQGELRDELTRVEQERIRQYARGIKYMRFGPVAVTIASNAFSIDGTSLPDMGPRDGFIWSIRRILVTGLATGATPDVVNLYRNKPSGIPVWQLNGNTFGTTFGKTELLLLGGETLSIANSGSITATGQVTLSGDALEVPAEEIVKLL